MKPIHPARLMDFDALWGGLQTEIDKGNVRKVFGGGGGLELYCYTEQCTYDKAWNEFSLMARGLILDGTTNTVIATPFTKFFNIGEYQVQNIPALTFTTHEKLDGSLIIVFYHNGQWKCATKGSFNSSQAVWAKDWLQRPGKDGSNREDWLVPGNTYLFEAIYTENRIVVRYNYENLVLLGGYTADGFEFSDDSISFLCQGLNCFAAAMYDYTSVADLIEKARILPASEEGFVLKFSNGLRLKIKGDEYCRIHRLVSRLTPLAMWEAMAAEDDLEEIRKQLPEEFWKDFDNIIAVLSRKVNAVVEKVYLVARNLSGLGDKEVGLKLNSLPEDVRSFIFPYRKNKGDLLHGKARQKLFNTIRPTGNRLEGYVPSSVVSAVTDKEG